MSPLCNSSANLATAKARRVLPIQPQVHYFVRCSRTQRKDLKSRVQRVTDGQFFQLFKRNSTGLAEVQNAGRGQGRKVARLRPGVDRGKSPDTDGVIERR